jgi:two-component sensor histidine kinase
MIREMLAGGRDRFIAEYDSSHDGTTRWFEVRARRVDLARRPWVALTHVDITERKAKETGDRLLIRELQHRLQNAVALISSLYSMSARRGGTIADLSVRFQARLQALAASYRLLDANDWHCVPLEQLAARVTGAVFAEGLVRLDGPPVMLVPGDTLNLALIFHELGTNAVKHGALRHGRGRVSISWRYQDDHLVLIWQERGGPPVSLPRTAGVGSQVIDAAASNLDARVDRICHRSGLRVLIHMPRPSRSG